MSAMSGLRLGIGVSSEADIVLVADWPRRLEIRVWGTSIGAPEKADAVSVAVSPASVRSIVVSEARHQVLSDLNRLFVIEDSIDSQQSHRTTGAETSKRYTNLKPGRLFVQIGFDLYGLDVGTDMVWLDPMDMYVR